jgi:hypothetical protein
MSDFIKLSPEMTKDAVQSLMQAKQYARSLENFVDALIPMIENEDTAKLLNEVRENAAKAGGVLQRIYNRTAREAFGVGPNLAAPAPQPTLKEPE